MAMVGRGGAVPGISHNLGRFQRNLWRWLPLLTVFTRMWGQRRRKPL